MIGIALQISLVYYFMEIMHFEYHILAWTSNTLSLECKLSSSKKAGIQREFNGIAR